MYIEKYKKMTRFVIILFIFLLFAGIHSTNAGAEVLDVGHSFTVQQTIWDGDIYLDTRETDTIDNNWFNYITVEDTFRREHFFEFDISSSGTNANASLDISLNNFSASGGHDLSRYVSLAYYVGDGTTNDTLFGTGTFLQTFELTDLGANDFLSIDVSTYYNAVQGSGNLGFRLYDSVWTDDGSGSQAKYLESQLNVSVVPEPISSALFLVGGTLLIGRRYIKKKRTA